MGIVDSKIYKSMEFITSFFLLNLIWLIMCIPIFTIFPATTAMFGVVREWKKRSDTPIFTTFFRIFKENFLQSVFIGAVWCMIALLLAADFMFTNQLEHGIKYLLFTLFFVIALLFVLATAVIFPVLAHYNAKGIQMLKIALVLAIRYLPYTLLALVIFCTAIILCFYLPAATLVVFSVGAYLIYSVTEWGFIKVGSLG